MLLTLLDALPPVAYWDADLRIRMVNEAFCEFFGVSAQTVEGRHVSEVLFPDVFKQAMPYFERALSGEPQLYYRMTTHPGGAGSYAQVSLIPDMVGGTVRGVIAISTDMTARHEAETLLAATESQFKLTLMASPVGIATLHGGGRIGQINPAFAEILGRASGELDGRCLLELIPLDSAPERRQQLERFIAGELATATIECEIVREDGTSVAAILNLARAPDHDPVCDALSVLGIVQVQDITERKRAEQQLRRSQERLEQAEAMAQMGTWEWDLRSRLASHSAGLYSILKLDPDAAESIEETLDRVHPDDRKRVRETLERAISQLVSISIEFRIARADGRMRVLELRADPIVDQHGEPIRLIAVVHDSTDSKRTQEALSTASSSLAKYAIELQQLAVSDGVGDQSLTHAALSPRQTETLRLVAQGLTNGEIAKRMFVSEATVKWHIQQILTKTNSVNRTEAVVRVLGGSGQRSEGS